MIRYWLVCPLAASALLVLGLAVLTPEKRALAQDSPEPPSAEQKLLAAEATLVLTFRPADILNDPLAKVVVQDLPREIERSVGTPLEDIDRVTVANVGGGVVLVVRARKAYDAEKLREKVLARYGGYGFKDKDKVKDGGEPEKPAYGETKAGGKVIYHPGGRSDRYTQGWVGLDKMTYATGQVPALERLLGTKEKASAEMAKALSLADSHSLVLALDGKRFLASVRDWRGEFGREFPDDDGPKDKEEKKEKAKEADLDEAFSTGGLLIMLPFRPLLESKSVLVTLDVKKTVTLTGRVVLDGKADMDDAETAAKSLLYMARQLAVVLPKDRYAGELRGLKPLSEPVRKAFADAKLVRKDDTLSVTVTLTPDDALAKKVTDDIAKDRKSRDDRKDRFRTDKDFRPKDGFKDKDKF